MSRVSTTYFKNYSNESDMSLANIPTKLMYKHRVDYYNSTTDNYTTVLYSIHIIMQQAT